MNIGRVSRLLALSLLSACNAETSTTSAEEGTAVADTTEDEIGLDEFGSDEGDSTTTMPDCEALKECVPPDRPVLRLDLGQVKQFAFDWNPAAGAEWYQLEESVDGEPHVPVGDAVTSLKTSLTVPLHFRLNASYVLQACNSWGCTDSQAVEVSGSLADAIGYFKASNTEVAAVGDIFGGSVALSGDGNTLAVGAEAEDSNAVGIDGEQSNDSAIDSGAVYVFVRAGQTWTQQAYIKASNSDPEDGFGSSLALSDDGDILAVAADWEDSGAKGIDGNQSDDSTLRAGAVYVFSRTNETWTQQAYVKASNTDADDWFGGSVALSGDGETLAVGAYVEDSNAGGVDGDQADESAPDSGAVYVFERDGDEWTQEAYIKASNTGTEDWFGWSVALSTDGDTLAVSAPFEASDATGIDGNQVDDSAPGAGAVYVFERDGNDWGQQAYVKASNTHPYSAFGYSVALSGNGDVLLVGAGGEPSNATGIDGNQNDDSVTQAGAAYLFERDGDDWGQEAYVKASNTAAYARFGVSVALSDDGSTLVVGAPGESSNAIGIGGDQTVESAEEAGAVYVFVRTGTSLEQHAYVKAGNTDGGDFFGISVAVADDGRTLAAGASWEDSSATGIAGNQTDDSAADAGSVYLY